ANHHAYTSATHSAGVHYFVMATTCSVGPVTAISNEISFTIDPTPTAIISAPSVVCDGDNINLSASTDVGTSFSWEGPDGFISTSQNTVIAGAGLAATGNYSLTTILNACTSPVSVYSVTVSKVEVELLSSTPELCLGSSATLSANT